MRLIIGLGNPGRGYHDSRHNIGFMCLNHFARKQAIRFDRKQGKARIGSGEVAGEAVILAKPQTYMNLSGESVSRLVRKFGVSLANLLVVHDDLDLPLGKIRIRQGGSSGGHKGVESIIAILGSADFPRLRIGIGRPGTDSLSQCGEDEIISYVLSGFAPQEKEIVARTIPVVSDALLSLISEGIDTAMNKYNP
jgi:PTH1 family peptidyl-tRNA hydrolase